MRLLGGGGFRRGAGPEFIDRQDEHSCLEFMRKYGMPERINTEVFISMAKALGHALPTKTLRLPMMI